ncbi:hypothetical protein J437_LFUL015494 [Ladona fulva]|uniref:Major facilitator superfamily (MFS) profile domain-containing protein n=1 Tax=Ladona fulva TaxID=123851 RepID=A0A8K0P9D0_LADFU|nr:hypothetical protein J437_LFUL015494 [Ladona fulva]
MGERINLPNAFLSQLLDSTALCSLSFPEKRHIDFGDIYGVLNERDRKSLSKPMGFPFPNYLKSTDEEKKALAKVMKQKGFRKCVPKIESGHLWLNEKTTFDDALENAGYGKFNIILLAATGIIFMLCALDLNAPALYLSSIICTFKLHKEDIYLLNVVQSTGSICGLIFWGIIGDSIGRRVTIIITLLIHALACILCIVSSVNYEFYIVSIFFLPFSIWGALLLAAIFLIEFHSHTSRGFVVAVLQVFWMLGVAQAQGFAYILSNRWISWTTLQVWPTILALVLARLFWAFFPETPRFLLTHETMREYDYVSRKMEKQYGRCLRGNQHRSPVCEMRSVGKSKRNRSYYSNTSEAVMKSVSSKQKAEEIANKHVCHNWVWIMREPKHKLTTASVTKVFYCNQMEMQGKYSVTSFGDRARKFEQKWKKLWVNRYAVNLMLCQFSVEHGLHVLALWYPNLISKFQAFCLLYRIEDYPACSFHNIYFKEIADSQKWCHPNYGEDAINAWVTSEQDILYALMVVLSTLVGVVLMMFGINNCGSKIFFAFSLIIFGMIGIVSYFMQSMMQDIIFSCLLQPLALISFTTSMIIAAEVTKTRYRAFVMGLVLVAGRLGVLFGISSYAVRLVKDCSELISFTTFLIMGSGLFALNFPDTRQFPLRP